MRHSFSSRQAIAAFVFFSTFIFFAPQSAEAAKPMYTRAPEVKIVAADGNAQLQFLPFTKSFAFGMSVATGDIDGDGLKEIVFGAGPGSAPEVKVYSAAGEFVRTFSPYNTGKFGVIVAVGDLDNDGKAEIVTGMDVGGAPLVRVFDGEGNGKLTTGFFAYSKKSKGGVYLAVGDVTGDGWAEIVAGSGNGLPGQIKLFDRYGKDLEKDVFPFSKDETGGVSVAVANVDGGPASEIVAGVARNGRSWVKVYRSNKKRTIVGEFTAFPKNLSGVQVAAGDIDGDGEDEVIVAPTVTSAPEVKVFEAYGKALTTDFFAYEKKFEGGVRLASLDSNTDGVAEIVVAPASRVAEGRTDFRKYVEVSLGEQKLRYFENGFQLGSFTVSTGKWDTPTPIGQFKIGNKQPRAFSRKYGLYMPFWMQFLQGDEGSYGLHELPEWPNGYKEGQNHLGIAVSHGCIRLGVGDAKKLYDWAEVGTTVIVKK